MPWKGNPLSNERRHYTTTVRVRGDFSNSIDKCVADTVRALIGCRTTFYNEAARGDIYFTQSVVRARVSEAPVDLLGRERRATA